MATIVKECDHLITSARDEDVKRHNDDAALADRLGEWFQTPEGTMADNPSWGHNLEPFKFEPQSPNLEVAIELAVVSKLQVDIEDIVLLGIRVEFMEIDLFKIVIRHQFGNTALQAQL